MAKLILKSTHRLLCGDSTVKEDVDTLMGGDKADMVYTDPPYGIDYNDDRYKNTGKTNNFGKIMNDSTAFCVESFLRYFSDVREVFIWGGNNFPELTKPMESFICWDKKTEAQSGLLSGDFELCWSKQNHGMKMYRHMWCGYQAKEKSEGKRVHPTQKPIDMAVWFFEKWGKDKSLFVDLFLGSGSTLIACEKTNRKCYGMELDEKYCDVIIKRFQEYSGKEAIRESDGANFNNLHSEQLTQRSC